MSEYFGENWIGRGLLKGLDFWPALRQRQSLQLTSDFLALYDAVCVNRQRAGKSGDFIASLVAKHIKSMSAESKIADFRDLIEASESSAIKRILLVEDGLFTGTEAINYLSALLGLPHPRGRKRTVLPLLDPKALLEKSVTLKFVAGTDLAKARLGAFLREQRLSTFDISIPSGGLISCLTETGVNACTNGDFLHKTIYDCPAEREFIVRQAFSTRIWGSLERAQRAFEFCDCIGQCLFRNYLQWKGWDWDPSRVARFGCGMYGLALSVAFAHSVPKASLPVFWGDGIVEWQGKRLLWEPLFPNAKT